MLRPCRYDYHNNKLLVRTQEPSVPAAGLTALKAHLRITHNSEDTNLTDKLAAAVDMVEGMQFRSLFVQTWRLELPFFPPGGADIELDHLPLISVDSFKYRDEADAEQTLTEDDDFEVENRGNEVFLRLPGTQSWPVLVNQNRRYPVVIEYTAGYDPGETPGQEWAVLPQPTRVAICFLAGLYYTNRVPVSESAQFEVPYSLIPAIERHSLRKPGRAV